MIAALTNHLWQSTLFVLAAGLVAAALRKNGAHIRHRIWVIASLKFLVPFSLLMSLGGALPSVTASMQTVTPVAAMAPDLSVAVDRIAQPFTDDVFLLTTPQAAGSGAASAWWPFVLWSVWAGGFATIVFRRLRSWRRILAALRSSSPVELASPVPVRSAPGVLEPGVVGVWRPVLLVPAGIEQQLTPRQLEAVLTHEHCHIRRRDNLTSAIHMFVEAAFWFHPVVWYVGTRLVDERERACDEHVLRVCGEPREYAESIISVCKLYVESPVACVSGVSGADLKKRIAAILANRVGSQLNLPRKIALAALATLAVMLPCIAGMLIAAPSAVAKAQTAGQPPAAPPQTRDLLAAQAAADRAAGKTVKFDVVSIKPCPGLREPGPGRNGAPNGANISPGYLHFPCITLGELIDQAYTGPYEGADGPLLNVAGNPLMSDHAKRIRGGPSWVHSDRFTIEVKMSGDTTELTSTARFIYMRSSLNPPLRKMIEDRFQLKMRRATEQVPMYALTVAKDGLKLGSAAPGKCWQRPVGQGRDAVPPPGFEGTLPCGLNFNRFRTPNGNVMKVTQGSLQELALFLAGMMDRFVLDKTGVDNRFTFSLEWASDDNTPGDGPSPQIAARMAAASTAAGIANPHALDSQKPPDGAPNIFKALEKLGLKLDQTRGPAEYYQIASVQKPRPDSPADIVEPPARAQGGRLRQGSREPGRSR